ncbi:hypothetical protein JOB18_016158, partial [Solea senegalensis]
RVTFTISCFQRSNLNIANVNSDTVTQTHRELDRIADSERRRYGALHWTPETVSVKQVETQSYCVSNLWNVYSCVNPPFSMAALLQRGR